MSLLHFVAPGLQPVAGTVTFDPFDSSRRTSGRARRRSAAEIALARFGSVRQREHCAERTSDRAEMAADTDITQHYFRLRDRIDGDGIDRAGRHAPGFLTLEAGERRITRFLVKDIHSNHRARRLKESRLHPGAS